MRARAARRAGVPRNAGVPGGAVRQLCAPLGALSAMGCPPRRVGAMVPEVEGRWEHFEHQADIGVRGVGPTLSAAFEQAAVALTAVLTEPASVEAREAVTIECDNRDREMLLFDWLDALVYEMATRRLLFGRFEVAIDDGRLRATAWGEPVNRARHQPAVEVKGATLTALSVRREGADWIAECVVDV